MRPFLGRLSCLSSARSQSFPLVALASFYIGNSNRVFCIPTIRRDAILDMVNWRTMWLENNIPSGQCENPMKDLKEKTIRGGLARLCAQGASFLLRLGSVMVLARLLSPR